MLSAAAIEAGREALLRENRGQLSLWDKLKMFDGINKAKVIAAATFIGGGIASGVEFGLTGHWPLIFYGPVTSIMIGTGLAYTACNPIKPNRLATEFIDRANIVKRYMKLAKMIRPVDEPTLEELRKVMAYEQWAIEEATKAKKALEELNRFAATYPVYRDTVEQALNHVQEFKDTQPRLMAEIEAALRRSEQNPLPRPFPY